MVFCLYMCGMHALWGACPHAAEANMHMARPGDSRQWRVRRWWMTAQARKRRCRGRLCQCHRWCACQPIQSPARSIGSALPPHVCLCWHACCCIIVFHSLVIPLLRKRRSCMRMLSCCGMYADVSEPLPPTEDVLSGMDEDFHPDGGSSEGKHSAAVPFWPPRVSVRPCEC